MDKQRTVKPKETWAQAINRLALQAHENGVKIYCHDLGQDPEFFATSISRPGTLHRVTLFSCDCLGFRNSQRCQHVAALLDDVGELPTPEPPDAAAMAARRAERVEDWRANVKAHADAWLTSLIARQERGESVPAADIREATQAVALYADASHQPDVALAA